MNNSPSNIFSILLLLEKYHQNCQGFLAAPHGMKGLMQKAERCLTLQVRARSWDVDKNIVSSLSRRQILSDYIVVHFNFLCASLWLTV